MRAHVANSNTTLPGCDRKQTTKPTTFMMSIAMTGIMRRARRQSMAAAAVLGPTPLPFCTRWDSVPLCSPIRTTDARR